ncbi:hypothetical protein Tco_0132014, partial [Tanacetum coccineum]
LAVEPRGVVAVKVGQPRDDDDCGWPEVGRGRGDGSDDVDGDEVMKMVRVTCHGDGGDESEGGVVRQLWWRRR